MHSLVKKYLYPTPNLNIVKALKPLYHCITIFGLLPYRLSFVEAKNIFKISRRSIYINALCAVSINFIVLIFSITHIQHLYKKSAEDGDFEVDDVIAELNYIGELLAQLLFCCATYFCTFINRHKYLHFFNSIALAWVEFPIDIRNNILSYVHFQANITALSLVVLFTLQILVNTLRPDSLWKIILVIFSFNLPHMVQVTALSFHYILNIMLACTLTGIQELIRKLTKERKNVNAKFIEVEDKVKPMSLRQIESIYNKVSELTRDVNKIFRATILVTVLQCLHSIISETYFIYVALIQRTDDPYSLCNCSIWISYQLIKIFCLSYTGNLLKDEAIRIGQILHKIPTDDNDMLMFMEIQHFSSVLKFHGTATDVYGLFPLDGSLMTMMFATVTLYFVIIVVQFDKHPRK